MNWREQIDAKLPDAVSKARAEGSPEDERKYINTRAGILKQCSSCGSARRHCNCGRSLADDAKLDANKLLYSTNCGRRVMSDLLKEARQYRTDGAYRIVHKLADEIERLQLELRDLQQRAADTVNSDAEEIERLQEHITACSDTCGFQARKIERLQKKVARMQQLLLLSCEYPKDCIGPLVPWDSATQSRCNTCERKREEALHDD